MHMYCRCGTDVDDVPSGERRLLEPALLLELSGGPAHGYPLIAALRDTYDMTIDDVGAVYRILRKAEAEGFVTSEWVEGTGDRRRRRYALTDAGEDRLHGWIHELSGEHERIGRLLAQWHEHKETQP